MTHTYAPRAARVAAALASAGILALTAAAPASAADEVNIDHVETADGSVSLVLAVDGVPAGATADPASVAGGRRRAHRGLDGQGDLRRGRRAHHRPRARREQQHAPARQVRLRHCCGRRVPVRGSRGRAHRARALRRRPRRGHRAHDRPRRRAQPRSRTSPCARAPRSTTRWPQGSSRSGPTDHDRCWSCPTAATRAARRPWTS